MCTFVIENTLDAIINNFLFFSVLSSFDTVPFYLPYSDVSVIVFTVFYPPIIPSLTKLFPLQVRVLVCFFKF